MIGWESCVRRSLLSVFWARRGGMRKCTVQGRLDPLHLNDTLPTLQRRSDTIAGRQPEKQLTKIKLDLISSEEGVNKFSLRRLGALYRQTQKEAVRIASIGLGCLAQLLLTPRLTLSASDSASTWMFPYDDLYFMQHLWISLPGQLELFLRYKLWQ